ncbi:dihydroorotase [Sporanaerobium hydrogeniformans]|uniref:Dihydroorotase n=1 Tax=Sporanaerobium hydrogeniformans TaxID=3072179 RepID=A0AC61DI34_9FIRM|nr:dihydroorotase [Sporanaerobium hydrogeniformans]PHV71852.1 dihydroorotase [Sporanaerobium hydrogeniformans]
MRICIQDGLVINPKTKQEEVTNVWIEEGKVIAFGEGDGQRADEIIDAKGKWVVPGLIDMHVHFRAPGFEHKEDIESGCRAAAKGGFTTVCCMPNTQPVIDNECVVEYIHAMAAKANGVNVLPIGAITKGQKGEELSDIGKMVEHGICAISEDGKTVEDAGLMKKAMLYAKPFNLPILSHTEDRTLTGGTMNAGENAQLFGIKGIPREAEEIIVARDILLAKYTGVKLHLCHMSTKGSIDLIRFAKSQGIEVTAETAPHYFSLDDSILGDYDANKKMSPPLRTKEDVAAMKLALKEGIIDVIATDHAPHHYDEKNVEIDKAPFGIVGLETSFAVSYTHLVKEGYLTPMELIEKMSTKPAEILGLDKGSIEIGKVADITIIDPKETYTIDPKTFVGKSKNTPFGGMEVTGEVCMTLVNGKIIYQKA